MTGCRSFQKLIPRRQWKPDVTTDTLKKLKEWKLIGLPPDHPRWQKFTEENLYEGNPDLMPTEYLKQKYS